MRAGRLFLLLVVVVVVGESSLINTKGHGELSLGKINQLVCQLWVGLVLEDIQLCLVLAMVALGLRPVSVSLSDTCVLPLVGGCRPEIGRAHV